MIERKIVSNVYGEEVVLPLSESEYQSIRWDWQKMVEEIEAEASSIASFAESMYMMELMSLTSSDADIEMADMRYDQRMKTAHALYEKAALIRDANRQGRTKN